MIVVFKTTPSKSETLKCTVSEPGCWARSPGCELDLEYEAPAGHPVGIFNWAFASGILTKELVSQLSPNCQDCPKAIGLRNLASICTSYLCDAQWWSRFPCRLSLSCCPLLVEPAWSPLVVDRPAAEDSLLLLLRHPLVHERADLLGWVKLIPAGASNLWLLLGKVRDSELGTAATFDKNSVSCMMAIRMFLGTDPSRVSEASTNSDKACNQWYSALKVLMILTTLPCHIINHHHHVCCWSSYSP